MTFGKPRYNRHFQFEILRLCFREGYLVVGGSERMFANFLKDVSPISILSYCDKRYYTGEVYKRLGFNHLYDSPPQKIWCKGDKKITSNLLRRYGPDRLIRTGDGKGSDNEEIMLREGWVPEEDLGQGVWVWESPVRGKVGYICRIINKINNSTYVGQKYWGEEGIDPTYLGSGTLIKKAVEKYGKDNFKVELIEECYSVFDLNRKEIEYIESERKVGGAEYNITSGGFWGYGVVSEETKRIISQNSKKMWEDEEFKEHMTKVFKDRWKDLEYKKRVVEAIVASQKTESYIQKATNSARDRWIDPEQRKKVSEAVKEYYDKTEGSREKCSEISKKTWEDEELRTRQSNTYKEKWKDPKFRAERIKKTQEARSTEEAKKKTSQASIEMWKDPEFRERETLRKKESVTEEFRDLVSQNSKNLWKDEEYRRKRKESLDKYRSSREGKEKCSAVSKKVWVDPERRKAASEKRKVLWKDPEFREKMRLNSGSKP